MLKDLRLSQQAAESADADTPMGQIATLLYEQFVEDDLGRQMISFCRAVPTLHYLSGRQQHRCLVLTET